MLAQVNIPNNFQTPFGKTKGIADLVSVVLSNAFVMAGIILVLLILFGGVTIIASAGSGNSEGTARGQKAISSALIGFAIIFTSYWIIQVVEIITGVQILQPTIL